MLTLGPGHVFQAKPGVMRAEDLTGMKWFGLIPPVPNGRQTISSLIVLSDLKSGAPAAVMGGDWITATRTAAMTANRRAKARTRRQCFDRLHRLRRAGTQPFRGVAPGIARPEGGCCLQPLSGER